MLRITANVFSGRPDPEWIITDEQEARTMLKEIAKNRTVVSQTAPVEAGLGFRGLMIEPLSDELSKDFELPASMYMAAGSGATSSKANEIAERLISSMSSAEISPESASISEGGLPLGEMLQSFLQQQLETTSRVSVPDVEGLPQMMAVEAPVEIAASCTYDTSPYNPGFWNNDPNIRSRNNCYNYASNKRTDTFAQPGRGCGHMYTAINCAEVTRAALCDGLHRRYDCFPDSEAPRYLVALVIAPGPGFNDFHWYRLMREGYWAHKPGSTAVRNVDNSGKVISNPATCDRGPYTIFCGYFYTCRSQKIN
ncbi:MAG: hypothetical protein HC866_00250 [Leptolyngbyaceae cyanobacterium RU_5_1]|nr:hypothetical protein [Leptolyngbyaceae cyanobacterium RU_5_1]